MMPTREQRLLRATAMMGVAMLAYLGRLPEVWAFPINLPNARTLFGGFSLIVPEFRVTVKTDLLTDGEETTDPLDRELTVYEETLTAVYGVTGDFTVALTLPIVQKTLKFTTSTGSRAKIHSSGVGDLSLVGVYRFYRRDVPLGTTQLSFIGGLELPTGSNDRTDSDVPALTGGTSTRIPRDLQPGSGSVDGIVGLAAFQNFDRLSFYGSLQGKINSEADDFKFGNRLHYDLAADYVLLKERNLFLILEFNGRYEARSEENERDVRNSGGHSLFISPGLQYLPLPYLILETSIQLPIFEELNATQLGTDFSIVVGLRYLF